MKKQQKNNTKKLLKNNTKNTTNKQSKQQQPMTNEYEKLPTTTYYLSSDFKVNDTSIKKISDTFYVIECRAKYNKEKIFKDKDFESEFAWNTEKYDNIWFTVNMNSNANHEWAFLKWLEKQPTTTIEKLSVTEFVNKAGYTERKLFLNRKNNLLVLLEYLKELKEIYDTQPNWAKEYVKKAKAKGLI